MRYFVTGATGLIGGRLVRQLKSDGHEVVALVRQPQRAADLAAAGVRLAQGDISDREALREAMAGADGVFHVAGWYRLDAPDPTEGYRVNVEGTRNVLEVMRDLAVPRGVYTSTVAVYSDTHGREVDETYWHDEPFLTEYDRTKYLAHHVVALPLIAAGLPLIVVQPGVVYGPGDTGPIAPLIEAYLRRRLPMLPRATAFSWAHVDDVARGHILAMDRGRIGESYNLTGPTHRLAEAFDLAERITGIPATRVRLPSAPLRLASRLARRLPTRLPIPPSYRPEALRISGGVTYLGSARKAADELGWRPRPLEQGLRETLAFEMARLGVKPRR